MPILIKKLGDLDENKWENLLLTSNFSSFYQTKFWAEVWEKGFPFCQGIFFVLEDDMNNYQAGLPLIQFKKKGFFGYYSMPYGTYGGLMGNVSEEEKLRFIKEIVEVCNQNKWLKLQIVDFFDQHTELEKLDFKKIQTFTHLIKLNNPDSEIGFKKRGYEQSLKRELKIREIISLEEVKICYHLYLTTAQKHQLKKIKYPKEFYDKLFLMGKNSSYLKWWVVIKGNQIIAYQINFLFKDMFYYWDGASSPSFLKDRPNDALMGYSLNWAKENKLKFYNLGGSPQDARGLIKFKEEWGGKRKTYFIYEKSSSLGKLQNLVRKSL